MKEGRIVFRTDASIHIGTGHVMRCLTLADALAENGNECHFLCRNSLGPLGELITQAGHKLYLLKGEAPVYERTPVHAHWLGMPWQDDARQVTPLLAEIDPDWLVVDHYALDVRWEQTVLPSGTRLLVIDDLADRPHASDILLDQNLGRNAYDYDALIPPACTRLIGPQYALLRPQFAAMRPIALARRKNPKPSHLLVTMGGVDKNGIAAQVLDILSRNIFEGLRQITVVIGASSSHRTAIEQFASDMEVPVRVLYNVTNMAEVITEADLAVGAAGTTSWERASLGLPTLLLVLADNQISVAEAQQRAGMAVLLGDARRHEWRAAFPQALAQLTRSDRLRDLARNGAHLCDGEGAQKVVAWMKTKSLSIRWAGQQDAKAIWIWRHADNATRFYSNPEPTSLPVHLEWYSRALSDPRRLLLVVEKDATPIAHIRFDRDENMPEQAKVSICLASSSKGQRLALPCLLAALETAAAEKITKVTAEVHRDNIPSLRLFSRAGFSHIGERDMHRLFVLDIGDKETDR